MPPSESNTKEQYQTWKRMVPFLYDNFINHHLTWPSLSCRWGPVVEESGTYRKQQLYLSEQTDGSEPNKLVVVTADISLPRVSTAEAISTWSEQAPSAFVSTPIKTIVHPGEVNKMLDIPQHPSFLVTHSDTPHVYVWNLNAQPDRAGDQKKGASDSKEPSPADLVLTGHKEDAEFALGTSSTQSFVASGGKDTEVLVWSLEDYISKATAGSTKATVSPSPTLEARTRLQGHTDTVNDVAFVAQSTVELASVSDDNSILFWDTRAGSNPVAKIEKAHGNSDVHCCDWNPHRLELLATGAADGSVKVWDRRNLNGQDAATPSPLLALKHHTSGVTNVEWNPQVGNVFSTGDDGGLLCIWDIDAKIPEADGPGAAKRIKVSAPPQLLFQHSGHQLAVVDFCWNPHDPWSIMSVSDDGGGSGGGTLQLWRVSDLVYSPEEEIMQELEPYRDFIATGQEEKLPGRAVPAGTTTTVNGDVTMEDATADGAETAAAAPEVA